MSFLTIWLPIINFVFMFVMTACNIINTRSNFKSMLLHMWHKDNAMTKDEELKEIKENLEKLL